MWASYIMFIDIGTQTGMSTDDNGITLFVAVCISLVGFVFLLIVLGVVVDVVRKTLDLYTNIHKRIIANGHTVILGWSDKSLFLLDEIAQMILSTGSDGPIVILSEEDPTEIISQLKLTFGHLGGTFPAYATGTFFGELTGRHYLHGIPLKFWKGDRTDPYDLERVSIFSAHNIVAIADSAQSELEADQEVLRTVLAIKVVGLHSIGMTKDRRHPRIITEMRLRDNESVVQRLGGSSIKCLVPRVVVNAILALSTLMPVLGSIFTELLAFDLGNELYELQMSQTPWKSLVGMTCREFMFAISDAIIVAVHRGWEKVHDSTGPTRQTRRPRYIGTHAAARLRPTDRLIVIARELTELESKVSHMQYDLLSKRQSLVESISRFHRIRRRRTDNIVRRRSATVESTDTAFAGIEKAIDSQFNYKWDTHKRHVVIMGWASDLNELLKSFIMISGNSWSVDVSSRVEVHILGGPRLPASRLRYWKQFVKRENIKEIPDAKLLRITVELDVGDCVQKMVVWHYSGRPSRAEYLQKLPLNKASAILILSDDDNESALASDSQCLTNLMMSAEICKKTGATTTTSRQVVCEILDPHTPKMVRVRSLRNPFQDKRCDGSVADSTNVTFFSTNQLETAMFALNCYNPLLTDFHQKMVQNLAGTRSCTDAPWQLPAFKAVLVRSLFSEIWDTQETKSNESRVRSLILSFEDIDHLLYESGRHTLVGWQRRGCHKGSSGTCINPIDKKRKHRFFPTDILVLVTNTKGRLGSSSSSVGSAFK